MDGSWITVHGKVPVFIGDDFELFSEQLECYFDANGVAEGGTKKSILLHRCCQTITVPAVR